MPFGAIATGHWVPDWVLAAVCGRRRSSALDRGHDERRCFAGPFPTMARPGLEPGTPRFSGVRVSLSNRTKSPAYRRDRSTFLRARNGRKFHAFPGDSGDGRRPVARACATCETRIQRSIARAVVRPSGARAVSWAGVHKAVSVGAGSAPTGWADLDLVEAVPSTLSVLVRRPGRRLRPVNSLGGGVVACPRCHASPSW